MKIIEKHKKIFGLLLSILFIILFFCIYYFINRKFLPYNSDVANTLLEARSMLNGNFFLKGWYLPQDNFFFEDNLFDLIALRVFGFKMYILSVAPALIYSLTVFTFIYFIFYKLKEKNTFNLFTLFTGLILIALPQSFLYLNYVSQTGDHKPHFIYY